MIINEIKTDSEMNKAEAEVASDSDESVIEEEISSGPEDASESSYDESEDASNLKNAGWADSIAKILRTKKPKGKKTLVLSKAKKLTDLKIKEKPKEIGFEIEGENKEEKPDPLQLLDQVKTDSDEPAKKKVKKDEVKIRVKPSILDKDRERTLQKIATRGVVQLFNAVRTQQKDIEEKLEEAGPLERKKEKVLKSVDKRQFLNVLMGDTKSQKTDEDVKEEDKPREKSDKSKPEGTSWNVLREDFMMGAKFKDWDKEDDEDEEEEDI